MSSAYLSLILLTAVLAFPSIADAKRLYRWVDENGVTHFSDEEPDSGAQRVFPSGMSVIPMRDNIRTQQNIERIKRPVGKQSSVAKPMPQSSSSSRRGWEAYEAEKQAKRQQKACESYEDRIDWIDSRLRAGGYSVSQGNRLRSERRELSSTRSWECLRRGGSTR
ncbi:DUF4124 domain-containing protein [Halomonas beimenensis]|uniref:DUF4124 domain-containing protein n=1 Tax=Halomonas beimenensis TaxID=475662 RepID=UPI00363B1BC5